MFRRLLVVCLVLGSVAVIPAARADTQAGCSVGLGLGATPVDTTYCWGSQVVRPGVVVNSTKGGCTSNFLFADAAGTRYLGIAGHCILPGSVGEVVYSGDRPGAWVPGRAARIGDFAYAVWDADRDFALIELAPGVASDPAMAHFGGPTGLFTDHTLTPMVLHHSGHGLGTGFLTPARTSVAPNTIDPTYVAAEGAVAWGDSGSGAIASDGRAVGVIVHLGGITLTSVGTVGITRLDYQLPFAEQALGKGLTLLTAPLRDGPI